MIFPILPGGQPGYDEARRDIPGLIGEYRPALGSASLEDFSSVSRVHSLAEAVLNFSLALLRLISSLHRIRPSCPVKSNMCNQDARRLVSGGSSN